MTLKLALVVSLFASLLSPSLADEQTDHAEWVVAFLAAPGSDSTECEHMKKRMAKNDQTPAMAEISMNCVHDLNEAGASTIAKRVPESLALSACEHSGWNSSPLCAVIHSLKPK